MFAFQKNQDAIRRGETHLGLLTSSIDLVVSFDQADRISPHLKTFCKAAKGSIYTTEADLTKTVEGNKPNCAVVSNVRHIILAVIKCSFLQ